MSESVDGQSCIIFIYENNSHSIPVSQKEPKLSRAHQIPEWSTYDNEIAQFARSLAEQGVLHSGIAAVDSNVLANAGASRPTPEDPESAVSGNESHDPPVTEDEHVKDEL